MKKKIAFPFPHLHKFGGGEIFCEYLTNFLKSYFDVDLYYYKSFQINKKIKFDKKINLIPVQSKNLILNYLCKNYIFIGHLYILFYLQNKNYNFVFSGAGEFFHSSKCFQYIHHPFYSLNIFHYLSLGLKKTDIIKIFLRFIISIIARLIFFINNKKYSKTITVVNSKFIQKRFQQIYKYNIARIVYPTFKIPRDFKENFSRYEKRYNDFVVLGRVSRDKNTLDAVNFFLDFKKNNSYLKFSKIHIIGPIDKNLREKIEEIKKENKDCLFHGYLNLRKRDKILRESKFGLHFFVGEHFGRSVLEMQKFGIIVFCHKSGGAMEIIPSNLQKFNSIIELKKNIKIILKDPTKRKKIKKMINKKIHQFSDNQFRKSILKMLRNDK